MSSSEPKTVYLAVPPYGGSVAVGTMMGVLQATARHKPYVSVRGHSLLALAFNEHWAEALAGYDAGRVTHFAMLHADVAPEPGWLDTLVDVLTETGASLASAVVPFKDLSGLTSTALDESGPGNRDEARWRRLTLKELAAMPETVTSREFPGLLANTGCWVADLSHPCFHATEGEPLEDGGRDLACRFTITDRILKQPGGRYRCTTVPEDWEFSRRVKRAGGVVAVTRRVRLNHVGLACYPSHGPSRGLETDPAYRSRT